MFVYHYSGKLCKPWDRLWREEKDKDGWKSWKQFDSIQSAILAFHTSGKE